MKCSQYFLSTRQRPDRQAIALEWIEEVVDHPEHRLHQSDGRLRLWARVPQAEGRWLRVVLLEDGETVHNAFFDRSFRP
ncbi:hypothetical protein GT347_23880 [Xylophilus rhododendri]|uniref:DUF4258 domain-containing protein n=1 Tax=Xylophilus rhododendri TaxID=2697032 RepID=A0A857JDL0_9BURK|nr:hypothetical protein [Xylophilus rhododendri]QHJ00756.1 hypothetical protein GT347_23880 [Xylophilus rhododendri]